MLHLRLLIKTKLDDHLRDVIMMDVYQDLHHRLYSKVLSELYCRVNRMKEYIDIYYGCLKRAAIQSDYRSSIDAHFRGRNDPKCIAWHLIGTYRFMLNSTKYYRICDVDGKIKWEKFAPGIFQAGGMYGQTYSGRLNKKSMTMDVRALIISFFKTDFITPKKHFDYLHWAYGYKYPIFPLSWIGLRT